MKIFATLLFSVTFAVGVFAQRPEGVIMKASASPVIDAEIDEVWDDANVYPIDKAFQTEVPIVDWTSWKALWDEAGIYILVEFKDDAWLPAYHDGDGTEPTYLNDRPELI